MKKVLLDREKTILELRFGLDGNEPKTCEEIASRFRLSGSRIGQIEKEALRDLRRQVRCKNKGRYGELEEFMR